MQARQLLVISGGSVKAIGNRQHTNPPLKDDKGLPSISMISVT